MNQQEGSALLERLHAAGVAESDIVTVRRVLEERFYLRDALFSFASDVETQLRENDHKGKTGWRDMSPQIILARICDELAELLDAFEVESTQPPDRTGPREAFVIAQHYVSAAAHVLRRLRGTINTRGNAYPLDDATARYARSGQSTIAETADVGAFLMMLADVCRGLLKGAR